MKYKQDRYTLSEFERLALAGRINLSDGHARYPLSSRQKQILSSSLDILEDALIRDQNDVEVHFLECFFSCAAQSFTPKESSYFLSFSASSAIKMAAQVCRLRGLNVHLIEPCFDNIYHLLKTEGVAVTPVNELCLADSRELTEKLGPSDVLWLVQPNNPTGFCLGESAFREIISTASKRYFSLFIDFCFRFYAPVLMKWDQYKILNESGVGFVCFEDTGKTWSIGDTKVGVTTCSDRFANDIYRLHDELLLNISPWHLAIISEFIKDTLENGIEATVTNRISENRHIVQQLIEKKIASRASAWYENVPMELLKLPGEMASSLLWAKLRRRGVDILPAANYMWSKPAIYRSMFRIPLARPSEEIASAIPIIEQTISEMSKE